MRIPGVLEKWHSLRDRRISSQDVSYNAISALADMQKFSWRFDCRVKLHVYPMQREGGVRRQFKAHTIFLFIRSNEEEAETSSGFLWFKM